MNLKTGVMVAENSALNQMINSKYCNFTVFVEYKRLLRI